MPTTLIDCGPADPSSPTKWLWVVTQNNVSTPERLEFVVNWNRHKFPRSSPLFRPLPTANMKTCLTHGYQKSGCRMSAMRNSETNPHIGTSRSSSSTANLQLSVANQSQADLQRSPARDHEQDRPNAYICCFFLKKKNRPQIHMSIHDARVSATPCNRNTFQHETERHAYNLTPTNKIVRSSPRPK